MSMTFSISRREWEKLTAAEQEIVKARAKRDGLTIAKRFARAVTKIGGVYSHAHCARVDQKVYAWSADTGRWYHVGTL